MSAARAALEDTQHKATFRYDALGRRVMRVETARNPQGGGYITTEVRLVYDGRFLVEERIGSALRLVARSHYNPDGHPVAYETWAPGATASTPRILITDDQGTVAGVADATGAVVERMIYSPTGLARVQGSPTATGSALVPFAWQGMYREPVSGRLHALRRDYDPLHGRWTSEDPMGMMDGWNRYHGYMGPNGTDPEGTFVPLAIAGAIAWKSIAAYVATQAVVAGVQTGIERGLGANQDMGAGTNFAVNWGLNLATGGMGGGAKTAGMAFAAFAGRNMIQASAMTGLDAGIRGQGWGESFQNNLAGSVLGEVGGRALWGLGRSAVTGNWTPWRQLGHALMPDTAMGVVRSWTGTHCSRSQVPGPTCDRDGRDSRLRRPRVACWGVPGALAASRGRSPCGTRPGTVETLNQRLPGIASARQRAVAASTARAVTTSVSTRPNAIDRPCSARNWARRGSVSGGASRRSSAASWPPSTTAT